MAACKTLKSVNARLQVRLVLMTFRVSRRRREMYIGLRVCLSLASLPYYCTDPDVTWGMVGVPPSCALLEGLAIGAPVSLL